MKKNTVFTVIKLAMIPLVVGSFIGAAAVGTDVFHKKGPKKHLQKYVQGEVLVKYKNSTSYAAKMNSIQKMGGKKISDFSVTGFSHVKIADGQSVDTAIAKFKSDANVESVQPNYIYHITSTSNDTDYSKLWGLKNTGQTIVSPSYATNNPGATGKDMDIENAWDQITDCSSVVVAVIDTGVQYNQEDLADNMWVNATYTKYGYDFVGANDDDPKDENGHGTHVAGTIGAEGNNATGITGVCQKVQIMAVRVLDATGSGTTADIVEGINFAVTNGAKVINMSLGGSNYDTAYYNAIKNARDNDVVVVVAAGNDGLNVETTDNESYPCEYDLDNIVCVAALDQNYERADFSNYGSTKVDIGAPGTNIYSTWPGTSATYTTASGTEWTNVTTGGSSWYKGLIDGYMTLQVPSNWNGSSNTYAAGTNSRSYKDYGSAIGLADVAIIEYYVKSIYLYNYDDITVRLGTDSGSASSSDSQLTIYENTDFNYAGISDGNFYESFNISSIVKGNSHCTLSFWMYDFSDGQQGFGGRFIYPVVSTLTYNNTSYNTIDGTSMATPHVAGLAAMIKAFNPSYTYADIVKSIKEGGDAESALSGITTTGKAADAYGSIKYIQQPTGVTAVMQ